MLRVEVLLRPKKWETTLRRGDRRLHLVYMQFGMYGALSSLEGPGEGERSGVQEGFGVGFKICGIRMRSEFDKDDMKLEY